MSNRTRWTGGSAMVLACSLVAAVVLSLAGAGAAAAQSGPNDPYSGGGVTPPAVTLRLTISLSPNPANQGETVVATVCGAVSGAPVQVSLDGTQVASGFADAAGCLRTSFTAPGARAALGVSGSGAAGRPELAVITGSTLGARLLGLLDVRSQVAANDYQVCGTSPGAIPACTTLVVLAPTVTPAVLTVPTPTGGHLAFTGIDLALLVAVAMVLILAGSYLIRRSRQSRRSRRRHHRRPEVTV